MIQSYKFHTTNWSQFENGKSLGQKGSENGIIIFDIEQTLGARITIEADCDKIPFAITLGIYGILFHTEYLGLEKEVEEYVERKIIEINDILCLTKIDELERNADWNQEYFKLIDKIVE